MKEDGLSIFDKNDSLDKVTLQESELKLLTTDGGFEVMLQELSQDSLFDVYPTDEDSGILQFFYVVEGQLEYVSNNEETHIIKTGDYFHTKKLNKFSTFKAVTNTKVLFVSPQPMFHYLSETFRLHKMNEDIGKRDKYTHDHCERVQNLALKIGNEMHLERERITKLAVAAIFHDLGKINIDDDILRKPEKLSREEFQNVRKHPVNSAKYVKKIKYVDVSGIVMQHHERVDGSGYPKGLYGDEILLEAKIIAVADAFDAMITERPYRKAFTVDEAVNEIRHYSGRWYDPEVVDIFIEVLKKDKVI